MSDYDLYGGTPPHVDRDTSREAAESIRPTAKSLRLKILGRIQNSQGMTCDEVEQAMGLRHQTASARIRELKLKNQIEEAGKRPTRSEGNRSNVL